jgi:Transposase DDE domain group 1
MDGIVGYATGEAKEPPLRPTFDRRIKLEFHGARITSDGGLLPYRELDDALGLTDMAITKLLDGRRGKNTRHELGALFRQSVFGRLAGYEGRVEDGRGGGSSPVGSWRPFRAAPAVRLGLAPFPVPAHRTGRADLPHPALPCDFRPSHSAASRGGDREACRGQAPRRGERRGIGGTPCLCSHPAVSASV